MALDRRDFLKAAAVAGLHGWPAITRAASTHVSDVKGVKLGIIGLGPRGLFLLEHFQKHCQVIAVCDVHRGRIEGAAAKITDSARKFPDHRELLNTESLDGVVIATPDHWHTRIALDALRAGRQVFCETPG